MSLKKEGKISFLKELLVRKEVLFGSFSNKLTKDDKVKEWKVVHEKALALGLVPANKDYVYTRDTYWQNLKKYTVKKLDSRGMTGSGGGPDCKFTETDNVILDIIGRDSPQVHGLPSNETWDKAESTTKNLVLDVNSDDIVGEYIESSNSKPQPLNTTAATSALVERTWEKPKVKFGSVKDEESHLRIKNLKLTLEILEKESYIKTLDILERERKLELPPSKFTEGFTTDEGHFDY